jgi:formylglycine-generating enzyme
MKKPFCNKEVFLIGLRFHGLMACAWLALAGFSHVEAARADTASSVEPRTPGTKFRECSQCPEMIVVPGGKWTMAAQSAGDGRKDDDPSGGLSRMPTRTATVRAFAIGVYDVTRDEYAAFVRATKRPSERGCRTRVDSLWGENELLSWENPGFRQTGRDPVVCVSGDDAEAYVTWLNDTVSSRKPDARRALTGPYRLPSWLEAEYSASGGSTTAYPWGDVIGRDRANYGANNCSPCRPEATGADRWLYTSPVGSFPPNGFGLYDSAGNVWQMTGDCGRLNPAGFDVSPRAPSEKCIGLITRGGSWLNSPDVLKRSAKSGQSPLSRSTNTGFRVARDLE